MDVICQPWHEARAPVREWVAQSGTTLFLVSGAAWSSVPDNVCNPYVPGENRDDRAKDLAADGRCAAWSGSGVRQDCGLARPYQAGWCADPAVAHKGRPDDLLDRDGHAGAIAGTQWSARKYMNMAPLYAEQTQTAGAVA